MGREERNEMEEGEINEMRGVGQEKRCLCVMTFSMERETEEGNIRVVAFETNFPSFICFLSFHFFLLSEYFVSSYI